MAAYDLQEQEQMSNLKAWWERYGNLVCALAVGVAVAGLGWQGWQWYQRKQATEAAVLMDQVVQGALERDAQKVKQISGDLIARYPSTVQAAMSGLVAARFSVENKDLKSAHAQLQWVAEHSSDAGMRDIGRVRLAYVMADENQLDEALKQVQTESTAAFAPRFAEARGDILLLQNKLQEAAKAYEQALNSLKESGADTDGLKPYQEMLKAKLDAVGGVSVSPATVEAKPAAGAAK